ASVDEPARSAEARLARNHDGLIAMLDRDLVEHPRDVVANGLLRELKRCGDLGIVQALGNAFEDCSLARGKLAEREVEIAVAGSAAAPWFREKASHRGHQLIPCGLI